MFVDWADNAERNHISPSLNGQEAVMWLPHTVICGYHAITL